MKRTISALQSGSLLSFGLFSWAIAAEIDFLPRLGDTAWLRWQVCLLAGLVCHVCSDHLAECRCRCCGSEAVLLRALLTRSRELLCGRCLRWNPSPSPAVVRSASSARLP